MNSTPKTFLDQTSFHLKIEEIVKEKRVDHLDAVILFCKDNDIDVEDVKKLFTTNLKDKVKVAAISQGLMKKEATLPI